VLLLKLEEVTASGAPQAHVVLVIMTNCIEQTQYRLDRGDAGEHRCCCC
jgi:hypothetical protein